ncbi:hypothetical protein Q7P37_011009 [Cladosporium fusiforme]
MTGNTTLGFIGLGNIGYHMATTLLRNLSASQTLIVQDVNTDAVNMFLKQAENEKARDFSGKVIAAQTAREVAEITDVTITCLPSPSIVKEVFQSILKDGALPFLGQQRLFIDCSTIDPASSREVATAVRESQNGIFVDAPVSGGAAGARAGTLSFMFGASKDTTLVERVKSVLSLMGTTSWHMGEPGAGICAKLANNYLLGVTNIAAAEAFNMGHQWGLCPKQLTELIKTSTGRCWLVEANNPVPGVDENSPASNNYKPGGTINILRKDLGLAIDGAKASGAKLQLAEKALETYQTIGVSEDGGKDFTFVYQWLQNNSVA